MARPTSKKKSDSTVENFIPMKRTRAMLSEVWDRWSKSLGHSPDTAKRMMTAAIDEMHKAEKKAAKKVSSKVKSVKKKVSKRVAAKKSSLKKKIK